MKIAVTVKGRGHLSLKSRLYPIWSNLDSVSQWIRIWIHWQIEWSGFVGVVRSDVVVICLRLWYCGFTSESTSKLDSRI